MIWALLVVVAIVLTLAVLGVFSNSRGLNRCAICIPLYREMSRAGEHSRNCVRGPMGLMGETLYLEKINEIVLAL